MVCCQAWAEVQQRHLDSKGGPALPLWGIVATYNGVTEGEALPIGPRGTRRKAVVSAEQHSLIAHVALTVF